MRLTEPPEALLENAVQRGGIYLPLNTWIPNYVITAPGLYLYLPPHNLQHFKSTHGSHKGAGIVVAYNTQDVYWRVLYWWYICSLDQGCLAPPGHSLDCRAWRRCVRNGAAICWNHCHRYDGSALNVLYNNYFHGKNRTDLIRPEAVLSFKVLREPTEMFPLRKCK